MRCAGLTICALSGSFTRASRSHCYKQQRVSSMHSKCTTSGVFSNAATTETFNSHSVINSGAAR